jgi:hypothetical protein
MKNKDKGKGKVVTVSIECSGDRNSAVGGKTIPHKKQRESKEDKLSNTLVTLNHDDRICTAETSPGWCPRYIIFVYSLL